MSLKVECRWIFNKIYFFSNLCHSLAHPQYNFVEKQFKMINNDRGQSLITKYVWVIETIYRRRKISFKELNELWLRDDISRGVDIPKRTFDNWRYVIWDM